nr:hypothetical protein [Chloroflexota bacterium]
GQDNAAAIAEIVTRLDGLPLAIELAAARSRLLTPEAMLPRLERRLDLLRSGSADLPARQQTLRGAIAWSHDLLDAPERRLFARLAVFMPGGGLDQVEAVCGPASEIGRDVLDTLESLVEHSLVRQREWEGEPRFGMLATIREFAAEQLAAEPDAATIGDRHLAAYVSVAETAAPHLTSADGRAWLDRIDVEQDNMRAALAWAAERNEPALAMRLVASLWRFWQIHGHLLEGIARAEASLAIEGEVPPEIRLAAVDAAGGLTYWHGDLPATTAWYQQALTLRRSIGGDATIAQGLYNLAFPVTFGDGLVEEAMAYGQEAVDRFRRAGDDGGLARSLWLLSNIASQAGDNAGARRYGLEAIPMLQRLQDSFLLGWSLFTVGLLDALEGDLPVARRRLREALEHFHGVGDRSGLVLVLDGIAAVAWLGGEHRTAARISGAVARLERTTGTGLNPWNRRSIGFDPAPLRDDPATVDDYRRGEADDDETIVAFALATMAG